MSSGIPELETHGAVVEIHGFREEINADRRLVGVVKRIVHESSYQGGLANWGLGVSGLFESGGQGRRMAGMEERR